MVNKVSIIQRKGIFLVEPRTFGHMDVFFLNVSENWVPCAPNGLTDWKMEDSHEFQAKFGPSRFLDEVIAWNFLERH